MYKKSFLNLDFSRVSVVSHVIIQLLDSSYWYLHDQASIRDLPPPV